MIEYKLANPQDKEPDPARVLTGTCASCGTQVDVIQAEADFEKEFKDWPACACPNEKCGAVVYVRPGNKSDAVLLREVMVENDKLKQAAEKLMASLAEHAEPKTATPEISQDEYVEALERENDALRARVEELEFLLLSPFERSLAKMEQALERDGDADFTDEEEEALETESKRKLPKLVKANYVEED